MLKAGALFYAIVIALLLALLSSAFILYNFHSLTHISGLDRQERLIRNTQSGINLLMADQEVIGLDKSVTIDLYQKGNDSIFLARKAWGLYEVCTASSFSGRQRITKVVQTGEKLSETAYPALYLADLDKPLSLCGKALLKGICHLPKAGVKRAYIEGESFTGDKLVDGVTKNSDKQIPKLDKDMTAAITKGFDIGYWQAKGDSIIPIEEHELKDTISNSFLGRTLCLYSRSAVILAMKIIKGNVAVISDKMIVVEESAQLNGVLLYAPKIIFKKNVTATVQAFAADSIMADEKCELKYPSAIVVLRKQSSPDFPSLNIKKECKISGVVIAWEENSSVKKQVRMSIDKDVEITGQVYSSALIDLKGKVSGSVMCERFMLSTPSSVYENHLLDAVIDQSKISPYFAGVRLLKEEGEKRIVKWLE